MPTELGEGEGEVNLIAWAGYVEDGSTDPAVDWVTPFEEATGCSVNVQLGNSSDEMVQLMQTGEYDGVSASGDATLRLIAGGEVAPVNVDLIPNYADVFEDLKLQAHNSIDGQPYGVPHGRGANLLVFNTDLYTTPPDSWGEMFEPTSAAAGSVSIYDSPIYIADAALYLMATQPDLGITNPYALDQEQFDASIALLEAQKELAGQYWSVYTDQQAALEGGTALAGTTWQIIVNLAQGNGATIDAVKPVEGATGWSRHVDDLVAGGAPQLHVHVDGLDHLARGQRRGGGVVRRGAVERQELRPDGGAGALRHLPRRRDRVLGGRLVLDDAGGDVPRRPHRRDVRAVHRMGQRLEHAAGMSR